MKEKKFTLNILGKQYSVEIEPQEENAVKIKIEGEEFTFNEQKEEAKKFSVAQTSLPKRNFAKKEIRAPIAGTISEIFVKEGEFIKKNKKVVLLSAMKMENEILSDFSGQIKKIFITKEQKVQEGEILLSLE